VRIPALILICIAATVFLSSAIPQDKVNPPSKEVEASTKKVGELQKERIATLTGLVDIAFRLALTGRLELSDLLEERLTLLKAEVDFADKESDRIVLYEKALESLKEYQALAKARKENAMGTELPILKIKATSLEIEILLEQAKIKVAKESK
jgi:hypothetical protein